MRGLAVGGAADIPGRQHGLRGDRQPSKKEPTADPGERKPQVHIPPLEIDLEALETVNKDAAA